MLCCVVFNILICNIFCCIFSFSNNGGSHILSSTQIHLFLLLMILLQWNFVILLKQVIRENVWKCWVYMPCFIRGLEIYHFIQFGLFIELRSDLWFGRLLALLSRDFSICYCSLSWMWTIFRTIVFVCTLFISWGNSLCFCYAYLVVWWQFFLSDYLSLPHSPAYSTLRAS